MTRNAKHDLQRARWFFHRVAHRYLALIGMADGAPRARYYVYLDPDQQRASEALMQETGMDGATAADYLGYEFEEDDDGWGAGWVEVTVLGDEYRRFLKPDGDIVEVPFGEHTEEENGE